ncbi:MULTISPECIES: hypothetical protein [unclassified Mesorhizobium]|uniref:hypothetical protein n=1 Tax=unclassified Mesorhizobium TaxID=325217 RepID=UPI00112AD27D|nr:MULTISPECIES: hypothetical protein [unclassified Mesorhizobium]TPJ40954.1 hypothetical protein FJ437_24995 [Mesorhizobium sp. B2-6-6]MCA0008662.1 hypothetical protein [Mesorhizobium sp. B264B1B]MCA0019460.1 hypothetical protein [Mesorhizobium sp. B264B1A]MCA0024499.1 hypothetical protein [Mesorhizobium sp. B263B1A]MCA0055829.1 hypothetical protein [Mesorhizobium sp. B261B1A]
MRPALKTLLKIAFDIVATIAFFYLAMLTVPYAVGFPVAGLMRLFSLGAGFVANTWIGHQSFLTDALLDTLGITYLMLVFAVGIEIVRRLVGSRSIWLYVVGAFVTMAVYIGPASTAPRPASAFALALPLMMAAGYGAGYWLVTIRLRAAVIQFARRLICGPDAKPCVFS